jgi:phage baseplate assembly protein W
MALRSFKDVGIKNFEPNRRTIQSVQIPFGIKTPLEVDTSGKSIFKMHFDFAEQMDDNLRNLIQTNFGDRLGLYNFGANLRPLLTEYTNKEDFDSEAMIRINTAISKWMPFVTPLGFDSKNDLEDNKYTAIVKIFLSYSVPNTTINERMIELDLFVI